MKLISKYNRANITATITVLLLSSICYYFILHFVLLDQLDDDLKVEEQEVFDYIKTNKSLPNPTSYKDQEVSFTASAINDSNYRKFSSKSSYNAQEKESISIRQLEFAVNSNGKNYIASIRKSQDETEDLVKFILMITAVIVGLLLIVMFLINRLLLAKLWKPFQLTLTQLKQFNLSNRSKLELPQSNISEFKELNEAVAIMTRKATADYDVLKSFTENASHEIQTPLAIIKSKLELLSQSDHLKEQDVAIIHAAESAVSRLTKINQSLLLLTKIENQQYEGSEQINVQEMIEKNLSLYEDVITARNIDVSWHIKNSLFIQINDNLADILISNLIVNAIKYNIDAGTITISIEKNRFSISNTGPILMGEPEELFERFKKANQSSESLGLGLAIVKKICEQYHFSVSYSYHNNLHTLTLSV